MKCKFSKQAHPLTRFPGLSVDASPCLLISLIARYMTSHISRPARPASAPAAPRLAPPGRSREDCRPSQQKTPLKRAVSHLAYLPACQETSPVSPPSPPSRVPVPFTPLCLWVTVRSRHACGTPPTPPATVVVGGLERDPLPRHGSGEREPPLTLRGQCQ